MKAFAFLTFLSIILPQALLSQQVDTLNITDIAITETNGLYYFLDKKEQPLNGSFFIVSEGQGSLELYLKDGLAHGAYTQYDSYTGNKMYTYNFDKGVRHGEQVSYHQNGVIRERYGLCYNVSHGKATHHDPDNGNAVETKYFVLGKEVPNEKAFNQGNATTPCVKTVAEDAAASIKKTTKDRVELDTLKVEEETVFAQGTYHKSYFSSTTSQLDSIKVVVIASDKANILHHCFDYKPAPNEIAIFYGVVSLTNSRQIHFALGDKTRAALIDGSLSSINVVEFFEHRVFNVSSFPGIKAFQYLELAIKKADPVMDY